MFRLARTKRRSAALLWRQIRCAQDGMAVVLALLIIIIMTMLGLSLMTLAAYQYQDADRTRPSNRAFDLADSGLSFAHAYLARDGVVPAGTPPSGGYNSGTQQMGASDSTFSVTIEGLPEAYHYKIVSTGAYQAKEGAGTRNYERKLEEVVEWRGAQGHFDCFNYVMFSKLGDISLDTASLRYLNGTGMIVDGNIYAGNDIRLLDRKSIAAVGSLNIYGSVYAGRDISMQSRSGFLAASFDTVSGNATAGRNISISAETAVLAGSSYVVGGSLNSGGNTTLTSKVGAVANASVRVAQNMSAPNVLSSVNAKGNVELNANATFFATSNVTVGASGVSSGVKAIGNTKLQATAVFLAGAEAKVMGDVKNNGSSSLIGTGGSLGFHRATVGGAWQHGGGHTINGTTSFDPAKHSETNPNIQSTDIQSVPDVTLPEPDWSWYRTWAIAQGHYYDGDQVLSTLEINSDPSSMYVVYVKGNVTISNIHYNTQTKGVIVSEGNVTVNDISQMQPNSQYQVIAKGDIKHLSPSRSQKVWDASDSVFLYTNGSYDGDHDGSSGNVQYDVNWFRNIKGQITAKGNISAPEAGRIFTIGDSRITYMQPSVPAEAWPIPFRIDKFREL